MQSNHKKLIVQIVLFAVTFAVAFLATQYIMKK